MKTAALIGLLLGLVFPGACFCQSDEDPFGGGDDSSPFAPREPAIRETPEAMDLHRLRQQIDELQAELERSRMEARSVMREAANQRVLNEQLNERRELVSAGYRNLVDQLIDSREESEQLLGLGHLQEFANQFRNARYGNWSPGDRMVSVWGLQSTRRTA